MQLLPRNYFFFLFTIKHAFKHKLAMDKSSILECTQSINVFFEDVSIPLSYIINVLHHWLRFHMHHNFSLSLI